MHTGYTFHEPLVPPDKTLSSATSLYTNESTCLIIDLTLHSLDRDVPGGQHRERIHRFSHTPGSSFEFLRRRDLSPQRPAHARPRNCRAFSLLLITMKTIFFLFARSNVIRHFEIANNFIARSIERSCRLREIWTCSYAFEVSSKNIEIYICEHNRLSCNNTVHYFILYINRFGERDLLCELWPILSDVFFQSS